MDHTCRQWRDTAEIAIPAGWREGDWLVTAEGTDELVEGDSALIED
jgi:hypothetical protein